MDLFEIMEAREGRRATLVASQLEPNEWHPRIEGELMADPILSRIATVSRYVDLEEAQHEGVLREVETSGLVTVPTSLQLVPNQPTRSTIPADWRYREGLLATQRTQASWVKHRTNLFALI